MALLRKACLQGGPWLFTGLFCAFCLAFYMPLSSKATNNIFYAGLALPALVWLLWRPSALRALRPFAWLIALLTLMVALDAGDWSDLKTGLYLLLFFIGCLLLEGGAGAYVRSLLCLPWSLWASCYLPRQIGFGYGHKVVAGSAMGASWAPQLIRCISPC